ncbi:MAG: DUF2442 domain-containing protein [Chlamydiales bacterium]|nr:DUF2442 domain-containing protein [Chlamydiales bacterium]
MEFKRAIIVECEPKSGYQVWIKFDDGLSGVVDLKEFVGKGVFAEAWSSEDKFQSVRIDPVTKTLTWGAGDNEVDLDPYVLRMKIS